MKILIACEFSGIVRTEFEKLKHNVWSCDILETEKPGNHIKGNVLDVLYDGWDMMIAHPPCTRLCNSGVRWINERNLWSEMKESAMFFKALLNAPIEKIAIENPIMHKYAKNIIGRNYDFSIQPHQFGHPEKKTTCFWTKNLPPLIPTLHVVKKSNRLHNLPPGKNRWKERSRTFTGIAEAMANQWG